MHLILEIKRELDGPVPTNNGVQKSNAKNVSILQLYLPKMSCLLLESSQNSTLVSHLLSTAFSKAEKATSSKENTCKAKHSPGQKEPSPNPSPHEILASRIGETAVKRKDLETYGEPIS